MGVPLLSVSLSLLLVLLSLLLALLGVAPAAAATPPILPAAKAARWRLSPPAAFVRDCTILACATPPGRIPPFAASFSAAVRLAALFAAAADANAALNALWWWWWWCKPALAAVWLWLLPLLLLLLLLEVSMIRIIPPALARLDNVRLVPSIFFLTFFDDDDDGDDDNDCALFRCRVSLKRSERPRGELRQGRREGGNGDGGGAAKFGLVLGEK